MAERVLNTSEEEKYASIVKEHPILQVVKSEFKVYESVYVKDTYSGKGQSVAQADTERDEVFKGLKTYLKGYCNLPLLPKVDEAKAIYEIFEKHDLNLDKKSYSEESSLLQNLIKKLDTPENRQKLQNIHLLTSFDDLKAKQTAFEEIYAKQAQANAELRSVSSATSVRKALQNALKTYFGLVAVMKNIAPWNELYLDLTEVVRPFK